MKNKLRLFSTFVLILAFPLSAAAAVEVSPATVDLGDVEVGTSKAVIFTIQNVDFIGATITDVTLDNGGNGDISITSALPVGTTLGYSESVDVEVTFTPTAEGPVSATLAVNWINGGSGVETATLSANGVDETGNPLGVDAILQFFDDSVAAGTLAGNGPGSSADGRKGALRNMIEAAGYLLVDGDIDAACQQLADAYGRCDGLSRPPDFVTGTAAGTLAQMILELMGDLGCA